MTQPKPTIKLTLSQFKAANPDAVIVADNPDKTPLIIQQGWNDVGLKTVYIAIENNQDPTFYSMLGDTGNGQLMESKMDPFMTPSYSTAVQVLLTEILREIRRLPRHDGR